jgi:hypothetical protein
VDEVKAAPKKAARAVREVAGAAVDAVAAVAAVAAKVAGPDDPLPLPGDRAQLLALHDSARRRRDAAPAQSRERVEASFEIERIEIEVARIERAMVPPRV